jgi:hypothetical protein
MPKPISMPAPAAPPKPSERTVRIGPEITIPGLEKAKLSVPPPAASAPPAPAVPPAQTSSGGLRIELPQRSGVGDAPPPPPPPPRDPNATIRLKPEDLK